jgi:hypothetical protein
MQSKNIPIVFINWVYKQWSKNCKKTEMKENIVQDFKTFIAH